jgi:hypothetical protein
MAGVAMRDELGYALGDVIRFWPVIVALSIGQTIVSNDLWVEFAVPGAIIIVSVMIIVYGRIIAHLLPERTSSNLAILRENWLNYLIAMVIIAVPGVASRLVAANLTSSSVVYVVLAIGASAAVGILTIYVLPIVFLKRVSVAAIPTGVVFLKRNLSSSAWIAGFIAAAHVLDAIGMILFRVDPAPWSWTLVISAGVLADFLFFVCFAAASRMLLGGTQQPATPGHDQ